MRNTRRSRFPPDVREKQWDLKAGVARDRVTLVSLRDMVERNVPALDHGRLSKRQQRALTTARLRQFPDYRIVNQRTGRCVDQEQAIGHVSRRTSLGRFLVEVEQEIIRSVLEKAKRSRGRARAGSEEATGRSRRFVMRREPRRSRRPRGDVMVLGIEPNYDPLTRPAWRYREKEVYKNFPARLKVTLLSGDKNGGRPPTEENVREVMMQNRFDYVTGQGHGDKYKFKGHDDEGIFETDVPGSFIHKIKKIKIVHLLSCTTGQGLGRDLVNKKKCGAFFGYEDLVTWDPCPQKVVLACDSKIDLALAAGMSASEAYEEAKKEFERQILNFKNKRAHNKSATLTVIRDRLCAPSTSPDFGRKAARLYRAR